MNTCFKHGLTQSKIITDTNGSVLKSTEYEWSRLTDQIATSPYSAQCACRDAYTYVPILESENTTIDGTAYRTDYERYDAYGNPEKIVETGSNTRTTTNTYWTNPTRNMVKGKLATTQIEGDVDFLGTFNSSYEYSTDSETTFGRLKKITTYGIPIEYGYDDNGNLYWVKDAINPATFYEWKNGSVSQIINPIYTVTRAINRDGTVASETNGRGFTTYYEYDNDMRLALITPPIGNQTTIDYRYDSDGFLVRKDETRGAFTTYTDYDGLGREERTRNSLGVITRNTYQPNGLRASISSNIGDTTLFDNLERIQKIIHQDDNYIKYNYSNNVEVSIIDEKGDQTLQSFGHFGNPEEKYLTSVKDAEFQDTFYQYNVLGSLLETSRDGLTRNFTYYNTNILKSETHPESGTTTYLRYATGNLWKKTENNKTTEYIYDDLNRLKSAKSANYSQNFWYDKADNTEKMTSVGVSVNLVHDAANRLTSKTSTINGQSGALSYTYDNNDNVTNIVYPSGLSVSYKINNLNQITQVSGFGASLNNVEYYLSDSGTQIGLPKSYTRSN
jgi:YD repeat-containing protein